jgi:hypothetical protein
LLVICGIIVVTLISLRQFESIEIICKDFGDLGSEVDGLFVEERWVQLLLVRVVENAGLDDGFSELGCFEVLGFVESDFRILVRNVIFGDEFQELFWAFLVGVEIGELTNDFLSDGRIFGVLLSLLFILFRNCDGVEILHHLLVPCFGCEYTWFESLKDSHTIVDVFLGSFVVLERVKEDLTKLG